jgi:arylsulfatase A-like enzyme
MEKIKNNPLNSSYNLNEEFVLIKRILLIMVLFTISRLGFYLFNTEHFPDITFGRLLTIFAGGLKFDVSAIMYVNSLYLLLYLIPSKFRYNNGYKRFLKYLFFITNGIALAANTIDFFYFDFILKRTTSEEFMFAKESNIVKLFGIFLIDYWYGLVFWLAQMFLLVYFYNKTETLSKPKLNASFYISGIFWLLLTVYFAVVGMRGGFDGTTRPIALNNAGKYVEKPIEMAIVLNTPFAIIRTLNNKTLSVKNYFQEKDLEKIYTPIHHPQPQEEFKNYNIVIFIIESFGKEYSGLLNKNKNYESYTPFFDSLMLQSKTFTNAYANGYKSIDALPSVSASIPSIVMPYVISTYATNKITGLASLLKSEGYETAFFHGAPNGSMGFGAFMKLAGYDKYFGMDEYGNDNDYDGGWGIWDEEFFQFYAKELNKLEQPFLATLFSLSSHHPFKVPKRYQGKFKKGKLEIHIPIQYTDMALKKFFETAKKMPWFNNTIFVITADHCNMKEHPEYNTSVGQFAIPIVFYKPDDETFKGFDTSVVQQIDIMPSLLHLLNYEKEYFAFGNDVFDSTANRFAVNYPGVYQIIKDDYTLLFDKDETVALYNYKTDSLQKENLKGKLPEIQSEMEKLIKAYIQQYNYRMINNKLTIEQ